MSIEIIMGCMYSGKTSEVIRLCNQWKSIYDNIVCINYHDDTRYGTDDNLYSHNLTKFSCIKAHHLGDIDFDIIKSADIILINEAQFFDDLVDVCLNWCETHNKHIVVSGLDGDFKRQKFGHILDLIPCADKVIKLTGLCSLCKDGTTALFTCRLTNEIDQVVIGSTNYIPVCRKHYLEHTS
jgi:thymidine kinase